MEDYIGKICPYCKMEIKEGDAIKACPSCGSPHHETCWTENKGCANFGCAEQHTNPNDICIKCGVPLGDGQDFCPKCGTPKGDPKKKHCGKCGAELADGQEYCSKCGQKVGLANDDHISSAIDQFNAGIGDKINSKIIILAIAIPVVLIAVGLLIFSLLSGSFKGKYICVSSNSSSYYNFEDDYYIYESSDGTERGEYTVEKEKVILTDSDKEDIILYRDGKYLLESDMHYDEKLQDGKTVNQSLTKSVSTKYEGYTLVITLELALKSDGTYTLTTYMTYDGVAISDNLNDSGTYERSGNKLLLSPKGENYTKTLIIKDGIVFYVVYMKEKL